MGKWNLQDAFGSDPIDPRDTTGTPRGAAGTGPLGPGGPPPGGRTQAEGTMGDPPPPPPPGPGGGGIGTGGGNGNGGNGGGGKTPAPNPILPNPLAGSNAANYQTAGGNGGGWVNFASYLAANPLNAQMREIKAPTDADVVAGRAKGKNSTGKNTWDQAFNTVNKLSEGAPAGYSDWLNGTPLGGGQQGQSGITGLGLGGNQTPVRAINPELTPIFQLNPPSITSGGFGGK